MAPSSVNLLEIFETLNKFLGNIQIFRFMEEMVRKVTIDVRKCSLEVYNLKKERALVLKKMAEDDSPVLPADLKLLEIEIGKLNTEIAEERKALLSVSYTLGLSKSPINFFFINVPLDFFFLQWLN